MIYNFMTTYSSKSRGDLYFEVEADSLEEAKALASRGDYSEIQEN
jgi:hypothetical protein